MTVSRAVVALHGVSPTALQHPVLTSEATLALKPLLTLSVFDVTQPIHIVELPAFQGFHLTQ